MSMLTSSEVNRIKEIVEGMARLQAFLASTKLSEDVTPLELYQYLARIKAIEGNINNSVSFAAVLLARQYLLRKLGLEFDATGKAQGARGLDIDQSTRDGKRVIAEIKTTDPYKIDDFGSNQRTEFKKDFKKLRETPADYRYFFVTEPRTFQLMKTKYAIDAHGFTVVLLTSAEEFHA